MRPLIPTEGADTHGWMHASEWVVKQNQNRLFRLHGNLANRNLLQGTCRLRFDTVRYSSVNTEPLPATLRVNVSGGHLILAKHYMAIVCR